MKTHPIPDNCAPPPSPFEIRRQSEVATPLSTARFFFKFLKAMSPPGAHAHRPATAVQVALLAALLLAPASALAAIIPNGIFQDNMVLQRDKPIVIWGWGNTAGETITVTLSRGSETLATASATASVTTAVGVRPSGYTQDWKVTLPAQQPGEPVTLTITADATPTAIPPLTNILIGDVWLCAGQSNMALKVSTCDAATRSKATAGYPQIRHFAAGTVGTANPQANIDQTEANGYLPWQIATPADSLNFSATALIAAIGIHEGLASAVPIGIVNIAESGTPVEAWMSPAAISAFPAADLRATLTNPRTYYDKIKQHKSRMYNGKLNPLLSLPVKGVLWYQGEANARDPVAHEYAGLFKAMITNWRSDLAQGELPFYYVQLPNHSAPGADDEEGTTTKLWPTIRAGQAAALTLPSTGMVVAIDIGETANIHPKNKLDIGNRLAALALNKTYGKTDIPCDSAMLASYALESNNTVMRVTLTQTFSGTAKINPNSTATTVSAFQVAGVDGQFVPATVTFSGDAILLRNPLATRIWAARYAGVDDVAQTYVDSVTGLPLAPFEIQIPGAILTDSDLALPVAEIDRLGNLMDRGIYKLSLVLATGTLGTYKHLGWPVATQLPGPDALTPGRVFVMFKHKSGHHGDEHATSTLTEGGRRIIWSDDLENWEPGDPLKNPAARLGDSTGMHAIGWVPKPGNPAEQRLVVLNGYTTGAGDTAIPESTNRVYISDDLGSTWTESRPFGDPRSQGPLAQAPHAGPNLVQHPVFGLVGTFGQQTSSQRENIDNRKVFTVRSTDAGATWDVHTWKNQVNSRGVEPALVTWGPGHMAMITREYTDYGYAGDPERKYFHATQHVYKYKTGDQFSAVQFTTANTNIIGNGKASNDAESDNLPGRSSLDTADLVYNPVSGRIETIQSHRWGGGGLKTTSALYTPKTNPLRRNSLNLWSIDPQDLLDGKSTWRFDGTLLERNGYSGTGDKDGMHPGGSIIDTVRGQQHIFIYAGVRASPASIFRISRPLDTNAWRAAIGAPVVTAFSPAEVTFGAEVTITGSGFKSGTAGDQALGCEVYFNGALSRKVTVISDTMLKATVPPDVTANGRITVRNAAADAESAQTFTLANLIVINTSLGNPAGQTGQEIALVADIAAYPTNVTYKWEISTDNGRTWTTLTDNDLYSGATARELRIRGVTTAMNGWLYRYTAANSAGSKTDTATLTIKPAHLSAPAALVVNAATGDIYATDAASHAIYKITANTGTIGIFAGAAGRIGSANGTGTNSRFNAPTGIDINTSSNTLVIADTGNHSLRTLNTDAATGDLAGTPGAEGHLNGTGKAARFTNPAAIVTDSTGNTYVADTANHVIRMVTASGAVTTLAGTPQTPGCLDATGTAARFDSPAGLALSSGTLYIADTANHLIRTLSPVTAAGTVRTLAGLAATPGSSDGPALDGARFNSPRGLVVDGQNLYIADTGNSLVRKLYLDDEDRIVITLAGFPGDDGDAQNAPIPGVPGFKDGHGIDAWLNKPEDIAMAPDGALYVADTGNAAIRRIANDDTATVTTLTPDLTVYTIQSSTQPPPPVTPDTNTPPGTGNQGGGAPSLYLLALLSTLGLARLLMRVRQ